ncbi:hypothetical protein ACFORJ_11010 [Corynebacterium hansenii]|uniref:Lipoprotein n=1 Tax=Corynebacterium hansenii TaxID=394964 RepID=A0ABV7ZR89_9CORY|nr:hypothetical protein [Corynebacterium hansenii]WJY99830.1 hypothetical protein CHAN_06055 [Corynebacterium hansenii]
MTEVDAGEFDLRPRSDIHAFDFRTGGNVVGLCLAEDGKVSCLGKPDASAPDATKSLPGRPNGIELTGGAVEFVNYDFTGGIPPEKELVAGQKVSFGSVTCGMVDDSTLKCRDEGAWFSVTGADRSIETGDAGKTGGLEKKPAASTAEKAADGRAKEVRPDQYKYGDGGYAFLLEDGKTACVIAPESSPLSGVGCYVELSSPPRDPQNHVPVSLFEMTLAGDAGLTTDLHPIDRRGMKTLKFGRRINAHGFSRTALGGADFACEAGGTKVVFKDGKTPNSPVVPGGAGSVGEASSASTGALESKVKGPGGM